MAGRRRHVARALSREGEDAEVRLQEMSWPAVAAVPNECRWSCRSPPSSSTAGICPSSPTACCWAKSCGRAADRLGDRVVWAPLLWLGNSHHHLDFAGTLSAAPRTYLDLLGDLIDNLVGHGFRRIVLLNGHGGNIVPASQAVFEARQRHRDRDDLLLLSATYWLLGASRPRLTGRFVQDRMGHACEWETSMILGLAPHLVGDMRPIEPVPFGNPFEPASRGWITQERSAAGHIGDPRAGQRREGRDPLPPLFRRRRRVPGAGDRLGWPVLGWLR